MKKLFLLVFCALVFSVEASATHIFGMELFYRWNNTPSSDSTYEFTLVFYRNCQGFTAGAPASVNISARAFSVGRIMSFTCPQLPASGTGVPPLQPGGLFNCLDSLSQFCVEEYVYRGSWTSPQRARDWTFSYQLCCISVSSAPVNVTNGTQWVECSLNNLDFPDYSNRNWSPLWHNRRPNHPGYTTDTVDNPPVVSVCVGRQVQLSQAVRNYDGDSIVYSLFWPQTNAGNPILYINGYDSLNQIPSRGAPISIDSNTGLINFIPDSTYLTGVYMLGVQAEEYRYDTVIISGSTAVVPKRIGYIRRNLFIIIEDSASCADADFTFTDTSGNTTAPNEIIYGCSNGSFELNFNREFMCNSIDTNGSEIDLINKSTGLPVSVTSSKPVDCGTNRKSSVIRIEALGLNPTDTFQLMIKRGIDGNTLITECGGELPAYKDTVDLIFEDPPIGHLLGDEISPGIFDTIIDGGCALNLIVVNLSELIKCGSIAADGSDFILFKKNSGGLTINPDSATTLCGMDGQTERILLQTPALLPGDYDLILKVGSDGNTLLNSCNDQWVFDTIPVSISYLNPNLGPDINYCFEDGLYVVLNPGTFGNYLWNDGSAASTYVVDTAGIYSVAVSNTNGCIGWDTVLVTGRYCYTGLNELDNNNQIVIYPNPSNGLIYLINLENNISYDISIRNAEGSLVKSMHNVVSDQEIPVELSEQPAGLYLIKVEGSDGKTFTSKVLLR